MQRHADDEEQVGDRRAGHGVDELAPSGELAEHGALSVSSRGRPSSVSTSSARRRRGRRGSRRCVGRCVVDRPSSTAVLGADRPVAAAVERRPDGGRERPGTTRVADVADAAAGRDAAPRRRPPASCPAPPWPGPAGRPTRRPGPLASRCARPARPAGRRAPRRRGCSSRRTSAMRRPGPRPVDRRSMKSTITGSSRPLTSMTDLGRSAGCRPGGRPPTGQRTTRPAQATESAPSPGSTATGATTSLRTGMPPRTDVVGSPGVDPAQFFSASRLSSSPGRAA